MDAPPASPVAKGPKGPLDYVIDGLAIIAGLLVCGIVLLICVDVFARNTALFAMPWSLEVAQYSMLVMTFFGAPWVLRERGHIVVDLILQVLPPETRVKVERVGYVICAIVCATLTYYSSVVWARSYASNVMIHETFVFPQWLLLSVAPPIFLIMTIIFVKWIIRPPVRVAESQDDGI